MRFTTIALAAVCGLTVPAMAQEEVAITHAGVRGELAATLQGELTADSPAILVIPGSGPTDRNGNSPLGIEASTYRLLAEALAERGIASVRIDKRGMFASAGAVADPNDVTVADYVADIEAWTATIRERSGGECVWLLGHSEGGLHAMAAASTDPSRYCGLLLVSTLGRNAGEVIRAQIAANPMAAPLLPQVDEIIAKLKAGERVAADAMHPGLLPLFGPQVQGFVSSLFAQEPAELLQAHDLPVLILNGREDLQTPDSDAELLAEAREDARLVLLERVNHVLKEVPEGGDRAANLATYADPDLPLAPGVTEAIADFVLEER